MSVKVPTSKSAQIKDKGGEFVEQMISEFARELNETQRTIGQQGQAINTLADVQRETSRAIDRLVQKLETKTDTNADELRHQISELAKTLDQKTSTDIYKIMGLLLTTVSVVVTFVILYSKSGESRQERMDTSLEKLDTRVSGHLIQGHPETAANHELILSLSQSSKEFEDRIFRWMLETEREQGVQSAKLEYLEDRELVRVRAPASDRVAVETQDPK